MSLEVVEERPFWFSKKVNVTFSSNWTRPYQGGCFQVLISSRGFDSSICDWKNKFSLFGKISPLSHWVFWADFRCVHRFQLLKVCDQYVTLPNSPRVESVSEEQSKWDFLSKLMDSRLILRNYRVIVNQWTKWNNRSFKMVAQNVFHWASSALQVEILSVLTCRTTKERVVPLSMVTPFLKWALKIRLPTAEYTFIQNRFHPLTLSSNTLSSNINFIQWISHPMTFSSNDIFNQ